MRTTMSWSLVAILVVLAVFPLLMGCAKAEYSEEEAGQPAMFRFFDKSRRAKASSESAAATGEAQAGATEAAKAGATDAAQAGATEPAKAGAAEATKPAAAKPATAAAAAKPKPDSSKPPA